MPGGIGGRGVIGAGGADVDTGAGNDGGASAYAGGGGGAGSSGGAGGAGRVNPNSLAGGAGGIGAGQPGSNGLDAPANRSAGASGGGGGAHGTVSTPLPIAPITGGIGGNGGGASTDTLQAGYGGGGGAGGYGAVITGGGDLGSLTADVTGGAGGDGGAARYGGSAGSGGIGLKFLQAAAFTNLATISGGAGGVALGRFANQFGSSGLGGAGVVGADLTIINSAAINGGFNGRNPTNYAEAIKFTGGTNTLTTNAAGSYAGAIDVANGAVLTLDQTDATGGTSGFTYANAFTGAGALSVNTVTGRTITLTGANTYTGATTINGGTLQLGNGGTTGSIANTSGIVDNGTLVINHSDALTIAAPISGVGTVQVVGGTLTLSNINTYSGGTTVSGGGTLEAAHNTTPGADIDALGSGRITLDNGTLALTAENQLGNDILIEGGGGTITGGGRYLRGAITGAGDLTFSGAVSQFRISNDTHTGATILANGTTVEASFVNAFSAASAFQVGGGTTLDLRGNDQTIASLADGPNGAPGGTVTSNSPGGSATLTLAGSASTAFSGVIQDGSSQLGLTLASTHTGTTTLRGASTYTGDTAINGGTLKVNGSLAAGSAVSVATGATLVGDGTVAGTVTIDGTLSGGAVVGTLATGSLILHAGATFHEDVATSTLADHVNVTGTVSLAGLLDVLTPTDFAAGVGQSLTIIDNDGTDAVAGRFTSLRVNFATVALGADDTFQLQGHSYLIDYRGGDGNDVALRDVTPASGGGAPTQPTTPTGPTPQTANAPEFGMTVYDPASTAGSVYGLYKELLGRFPDPLGLESFTTAVQNGASLADVANALLASGERAGMPNPATNPTGFVQGLYQSLLGRAADTSGLQTFTGELAAGVSPGTVAVQLATSAEAQAILKPTFAAGVFVPDASEASVARLYYGLLGRAPDAGGLKALSAFVENGGGGAAGEVARLGQAAASIISSPEFATSHPGGTDTAFVTSLYQGALGRSPDAGGQALYLDQLSHGVSRATVALEIAQSPEAQVHLVGVIEQGFQLAG